MAAGTHRGRRSSEDGPRVPGLPPWPDFRALTCHLHRAQEAAHHKPSQGPSQRRVAWEASACRRDSPGSGEGTPPLCHTQLAAMSSPNPRIHSPSKSANELNADASQAYLRQRPPQTAPTPAILPATPRDPNSGRRFHRAPQG